MTISDAFCVSRTMQAIEVLAFQPSSAPQVAGALKVHPRTARRLLNRLVADGWATRSEGQRRTYAPTMRIIALAAHVAERSPLAVAAQPMVTRLHEDSGWVAHLVVPSYRSVLTLVHRAGGPDARPQLRELSPAHASAAGKVLLASRAPWRESVLELPLERLTDRTVADAQALREEAEAITARGYATEDGELDPTWRGVAVPVIEGGKPAFAGLGLSARVEEATMDELISWVARLRADAATIAVTLEEGAGG